jgi:putative flippase GtrA
VRVFRSYPALAYQGLRFALTGLASYLLYVSLFFVFSQMLREYTSLTLAYIAAAALHFVASKYFTFLHKNRENIWAELLKFVVLLCFTTLANWASFYCVRTGFRLDVSIALFIGILASSTLSFTVMRAWVFARR